MLRSNGIPTAFLLILSLLAGCNPSPSPNVISDDGLTIEMSEYGEGENTLLLVHGWSNDRQIWDRVIPELQDDFRVIALDLPGFGQSGYQRNAWTMEAYGRDVLAVIDQMDLEEVVVVGFSLGAAPCVEVAGSGSERVKGLVIVDSLQSVGTVLPQEGIDQLVEFQMQLIINDGQDFTTEPNQFFQKDTVAARELVIRMLSDRKNINRDGWEASLRNVIDWVNNDSIMALTSVSVPVIGIYSTMQPVNEASLKTAVSQMQIEYIPDAGHALMWDDPDGFSSLLKGFAESAFAD